VHQRITLFNATGSVAAVVFGPNAIDLGATKARRGRPDHQSEPQERQVTSNQYAGARQRVTLLPHGFETPEIGLRVAPKDA
jgi:hypothetical protein